MSEPPYAAFVAELKAEPRYVVERVGAAWEVHHRITGTMLLRVATREEAQSFADSLNRPREDRKRVKPR